MDALRIKTLEEDNQFLLGQVQLLEQRNRQLELRIAQLTAFIPSFKANGIPPALPLDSKNSASSSQAVPAEPNGNEVTMLATNGEEGESQPPTPTASSTANVSSSKESKSGQPLVYRGPAIDTSGPTPPTTIRYDPPTPRQTPIETRASSGVPSSSLVRMSTPITSNPTSASASVAGVRARAQTLGVVPFSRHSSSPKVAHPNILKKIFILATNTQLPSPDPFFQSSTNTAWNESVRLIKTLCLVSKDWHASAIALLYTTIRLRRIPQLSALVYTLEYRMIHRPAWASKSYGSYTTTLDLSFYIPPEWNNLYVDDLRRLLVCVPNLQCYRSRPMLPMLGPRPVPTPILICLADTRNELLSELELSEQEGPQMPDLVRLLQSCNYLEKLTLGKYVFDGGLGSNTPVLRLPSLKSLEVKVTTRLTPGSFASHPSPHVLAEAAKWDLPHLESLTLVLHDEMKFPFPALHPFLNIHGHKLRQFTLKDANPLMRGSPLQISGILSRCPNLEEICVVASSTAPLVLARPHHCLERIRFFGVAPGSRRDGANGDLGHLLAFGVDNVEGRSMFPKLRELVLVGEEDERDEGALRFLWEDAVGPNLAVTFVGLDGVVKCPNIAGGSKRPEWGVGNSDSDEEEWLPDEDSDEDSDNEEEWLIDDEKSDDETVRDSRSGREKDDDQIDHTTALLIFQDSHDGIKKVRHSFGAFPLFFCTAKIVPH
ncbi:hypothetical protein M408DRAFT_17947 [Serendipita vermifera MAFF 305830]|uniref:Uncharacterized protein n=1 Tax=Serendipita vermifera MAFF 305830 TaxID=933852 RepID=A0A0C3AVB4_SERVB|nr:hypothetical protein M408DRAFT_17947 [Serendipita vermifera MAFF 305830]